MTNEEILRKADFATADLTTGKLAPAQALAFMRQLIEESVFMKLCTIIGMKSMKQQIDKLKFASRILRNGVEGQSLSEADRGKVTLSQVELNAQLFKAECRMTTESLEDSIEKGTLRETIMALMVERVSLDMEEVAIKGDTASSDTFLASFNGLLKQITSNSTDATDTNLSKTVLKAMTKLMPSQYLRNKKQMAFLTSIDAETDYRDSITTRDTVAGDRYLLEDVPALYNGIPVRAIPLFPENVGTSSHCTQTVLMDPKNFTVGIWRDITVETEKLIREGVYVAVVTMRFDGKLVEETATTKAINVKVV